MIKYAEYYVEIYVLSYTVMFGGGFKKMGGASSSFYHLRIAVICVSAQLPGKQGLQNRQIS